MKHLLRLKISVVVCTNKRDEHLIFTLKSLANQNYPGNKYEVIVVDNSSVKNNWIQKNIKKNWGRNFFITPDRLKYIYFPINGLSEARNMGLYHSKGEIICFIDDDAVATNNWLTTIENAFQENPQAGVIGGHILLKAPEPKPKILEPGWEIFWSQFSTDFIEYTEVKDWKNFPWGANWCARRSALLEIGGFDTRYGRGSFGRKYWCGEELIAAIKIQKLGYKIAVEPKSIVIHEVDQERFTLSHLWNVILFDKIVRRQAEKDGILEVNTLNHSGGGWKKACYFLRLSYNFLKRNKHPILFLFQFSAHMVVFFTRIGDFIKTLCKSIKSHC